MSVTVEHVVQEFRLLRQAVGSLHSDAFLSIDVTMSQAQLLVVVAMQPDLSISAIAGRLKVGLSAVSGLVERLVEHGYLARREDPADRRQHLVSITPEGRGIVDRLRDLDDSVLRQLLAGLSASELRALDTGIEALARQAAVIASGTSTNAPSPERTSP